ncbi:MAG: GGDEF domain-containing protein [Janthinobacterium lividum]
MHIEPSGTEAAADACLGAMRLGFAESLSGLCLCDEGDLIRYVNERFRSAFLPTFDGQPADFIATVVAGMRAGLGLRILEPDAFTRDNRRRRLELVGSRSFSTDTMDGAWWSVTDTKLSNGWMLSVTQDITSLKNQEAMLRDAHDSALLEAQTDYLTGAPNRRHGLRRAEALWQKAQEAAQPLSIALLDVDHFKAINDKLGHEAGDHALVHLSRWIMRMIRSDDIFSRLGGDEFLLIRPQSRGAALDAALVTMLAAIPPLGLGSGAEPLHLSLSVGIAEARPSDTWAGLMHRADMALYDAKAGGRNRTALAG